MFSSQIYCVTFVNHRCTGGFTYFTLHFIHATFCIEPRIFFLLELSNHLLRPLHRLFPHQGKCRFLHSDGRFHRLHRHSGGIGSERMFQPGFKLAGILQYDGRDSRNRLHLCVHLSNDLSDTKIQKRETG